MKKIISILILLGTLMTMGCAEKGHDTSDQQPITAAVTEAAKASVTETVTEAVTEADPTPSETEESISDDEQHKIYWVNGAIKENLTENMELSPKEDFHLYVNYDWLKSTEIPTGYSSWSCFDAISKETNEKIMAVISDDTLESHDAELVRDLYHALIDWDERNSRGIEPLVRVIEDIGNIRSLDDLTRLISDRERSRDIPWFIEVEVTPGMEDSSKYIVEIKTRQHNNGFKGEFSYLRNPAEEKKLFADIMSRIGYSRIDAAQMYDVAMNDVEPYLLVNTLQYEDASSSRFYQNHTTVMTKEEVGKLTSTFPLLDILQAQGYGEAEEYQVVFPELFKNLDMIYTEDMLEKLKKYLIACSVMNMASYMDREANGICRTYLEQMTGMQGSLSDEQEALSIVDGKLDVPLSRAFIQKYDASEIKTVITKLIEEIVTEYKDMLNDEEWLSEETKKQAIEKLDSLEIHAIYPDEWADYSQLDLEGLSYWEAIVRIRDYEKEKELSRIGKSVNDNKWRMSTLETNAYYDVQENSINILLGIMGGDLYHDGISDEELYAGIGTMIGHEISHAFDTKGASYDKNGDYKDWWTKQDYEAFQTRVDKLVSFYDRIPAGNSWYEGNINGSLICSEAIADMAGMKVILKLAEKKDNFDYEKFFIAYAKYQRKVSTYELEKYLLMIDGHPLNYLRTNVTLQQFDIFFKTFDIHKGDNMYLDENDRVNVW